MVQEVVGKNKDTRLYLSTMKYGAFDFVLPPFEPEALTHVVRAAAENTRRRNVFALLVSNKNNSFKELKSLLKKQAIEVWSAWRRWS